jgi:hypothetical protein
MKIVLKDPISIILLLINVFLHHLNYYIDFLKFSNQEFLQTLNLF